MSSHLKSALKHLPLRDLLVKPNDKSRTEINYVAMKLCTLNFPRLIKQCLINLPKSLEEPHLHARKNLVLGIRDLYYSEKDKEGFKVILGMNDPKNKGLVIDNVVSTYYSTIYQLPEVFNKVTRPPPVPKGFEKSYIVKNCHVIRDLLRSEKSLLLNMLNFYDSENDRFKKRAFLPSLSSYRPNKSLGYYFQASGEEKDEIFDTVDINEGGVDSELPILLNKFNQLTKEPYSVHLSFDHTIVRGDLFYTEFYLDHELIGCGLDFNTQLSLLRLIRVGFRNEKFELWVKDNGMGEILRDRK